MATSGHLIFKTCMHLFAVSGVKMENYPLLLLRSGKSIALVKKMPIFSAHIFLISNPGKYEYICKDQYFEKKDLGIRSAR